MNCAHCNSPIFKATGAVNRAVKEGAPLYCNRTCAGLARRKDKTAKQKKLEKRLYDEQYRAKNAAILKAKKAAAYKRNFDREKEATYRKQHMARHVEYCRRPEYKEWKKKYDLEYRNKQDFGEFWEAAILALNINEEVKARMTRFEIYQERDTLNKAQKRKRENGNSVRNRT